MMNIEKIIQEFQSPLRSFIRKRVPTNEDAEDILQDVFYQMLKTIESATNPIQQVSGWLYKVSRNTIINKRKKKKEVELSDTISAETKEAILTDFADILFSAPSDSSPETEYLRSLFWVELEDALSELPVEQREIFELTELKGLSIKEIALNKNVPENTILSRKHYAIKHLRIRLIDLYHDMIYS